MSEKVEAEPRIVIKALATLLLEKKIITGEELNEVIWATIFHEQEKGDEKLK